MDSNIIVESLKKNGNIEAVKLWNTIIEYQFELKFFTNIIVFSEVVYQLILKSKRYSEFSKKFIYNIFDAFYWCDSSFKIKEMAIYFIEEYNLAPNDAIVCATCKFYNIPYLISLDDDFRRIPDKIIKLIDSYCKLEKLIKGYLK